MNIREAKQLLADNGIHQLNQGESLADAIHYVENGGARKGYRVKSDYGRRLSENEIIRHENKLAFEKSFAPASFEKDTVDGIDDIPNDCDLREEKALRGVIINCFYCGDCLRVDGEISSGHHDYAEPEETLHCHGCMNDAISRLAM